MTNCLVRIARVAAVLAVVPLVSHDVLGQERSLTAVDVKSTRPTPRTASGRPDLSGYWKGTRDTRPGGNIGKDLPGWKLPLTPAGEAALQHNLTATVDPEALCIIGGIPRHNASGLPFEILQGVNKIAFMYWYSYFRLIPIDPDRKHTDDPDPSFFGEELGRWEGDTLVIETTNFSEQGNFRGAWENLKVTERLTRKDARTINYRFTVEDPTWFTAPMTGELTFNAMAPGEMVYEYACHEGNYSLRGMLAGARADEVK